MRVKDLTAVAILGAAGRMGSETALLLLNWLEGRVPICCIDSSSRGLERLRQELAERVHSPEFLQPVQFSTSPDLVAGADLIFEAIPEEFSAKCLLLEAAGRLAPHGHFFTNTSAIPISALDEAARLGGRIIGFHFFNPPSRQGLVELICPDGMRPELTPLSLEIARSLGKRVVFSADVAGFISNGHFLREIRYACHEVEELAEGSSRAAAIALLNEVTRDLLVRPMGIFELVDYVGAHVCQQIGGVMSRFLSGADFQIGLLDQVVAGGGSFFQYEEGRPARVFDPESGNYVAVQKEEWPIEAPGWRQLRRSKECREQLRDYFARLFSHRSAQAEIARDYLLESREIAQQLVRNGVAREIEAVNRVLQLGFAHLYGPGNDFY